MQTEKGWAAPALPGFLLHPEMLRDVQGEETYNTQGFFPSSQGIISALCKKLDTTQGKSTETETLKKKK